MSNTLACNTNVWFLCLCSIEHRAYIYVDVHYIGLNERWCFRLWPGICMFNVMCPNREIFRNEVNVLFVCNDLFFFAYFFFLSCTSSATCYFSMIFFYFLLHILSNIWLFDSHYFFFVVVCCWEWRIIIFNHYNITNFCSWWMFIICAIPIKNQQVEWKTRKKLDEDDKKPPKMQTIEFCHRHEK